MAKKNSLANFFNKNRSEIGVGVAIASGVLALGTSIIGTIKACKTVNKAKKERNVEKLPVLDTIKLVWSYYIPPILLETASILFILDSHKASRDSILALSAAYLNADTVLKTYKEKVIETIGEKKEKEIHDAVLEDRIKANPVGSNEVILTKSGNTLMFDVLSGRYFESDIETVRQKINDLNRRMRDDWCISLNEFYDEIGLARVEITGEKLGWNIDRGYIEVYFGAQVADDGRPCIVLDYAVAPDYNYQ